LRFPGGGRMRLKTFAKRLYEEYENDAVADSAAALSYYFVFALFPFLFFLATLTAFVPDGGVLKGLDAVLAEAVRVQKRGFTATELNRAKQNLLRSYERTFAERDKRQSAALVGELVRNFLNQEAIPGIEYEYPLAQRLVPGIKLDEVNRLAGDWLGQKNRVIAVNAPEKAGVTVPSASQLLAVFDSVAGRDLAAYDDGNASRSLRYLSRLSASPSVSRCGSAR